MTSTLFNRAYVRGLNAELVRSGAIQYPTKEAADQAADYVADRSGMPDVYAQPGDVTLKVAGDLCTMLVRASETLCKQAGHVDAGLAKTAASLDPQALAAQEAFALMQKVAYENETPNTPEEAAQHSSGARLDQHNRPTGYANTGVGNYEDKGKGAVGVEEEAHRGDRVEGSNSAEETSKAAMASAIARLKQASGLPYYGQPNTPGAAAQHSDGAKLDQHNRPAGYAHKGVDGVGKSDVKATGSAIIGKEEAAHRGDRVSGSNSVTPLAKSAMVAFDKTAAATIAFLPNEMGDAEKVAHINAMLPLSAGGRAKYLERMYLAYGADKTAAARVSAAFRKKAEDEAEEEMEVAKAMEQAAEELEHKAKSESETETSEEKPMISEEIEEVKEAALKRLSAAASRIASR